MQAGFEEKEKNISFQQKKKVLILCCLNANVIVKTQSTLNIDILQLKKHKGFLNCKVK